MTSVLSYVSQMFSWLGGYVNFITSNAVIALLVALFVGVPLLIQLFRRYIL